MLVYSTPYDPTNWAQNDDIPEDGAGDIQQPTWDGDGFTALHAFGNQLIAFKKTRVWRILGVNPGEYSFKEQYGGGAPLADTIAVDNERIFMFTRHGAAIYDGLSVSPFQQETCRTTLQKMNLSAIDKACACMFRGKYYCAFPTGESEVNNVVLVYDTLHNTWLTRDDIQPEAFLASSDVLYFTSASTPGQIWTLSEDCWETGQATQGKSTWTTPWIDYGNKTITKGSFEVYLLGEVQSTPVTLTVSLETEKKIKSKLYTIHPTRGDERAPRNERLYFSGDGKRFRLIIQSPENQGVWRLVSSISIVAQVDSE